MPRLSVLRRVWRVRELVIYTPHLFYNTRTVSIINQFAFQRTVLHTKREFVFDQTHYPSFLATKMEQAARTPSGSKDMRSGPTLQLGLDEVASEVDRYQRYFEVKWSSPARIFWDSPRRKSFDGIILWSSLGLM